MTRNYNISITVSARDKATPSITRVNTALGDMGRIIGGYLGGRAIYSALSSISDGVRNIGVAAVDATAKIQATSVMLHNLAARDVLLASKYEDAEIRVNNLADALAATETIGERLMDRLADIAIVSPFSYERVTETYRMAQAFGFSSGEAMKFTKATLEMASAIGADNSMLQRMAYNLAQLRRQGKVTSVDVRQLALAGMDLLDVVDFVGEKLGKDFGHDIDKFNDAIQSGEVTWKQFTELYAEYAATYFGGSSERMARTLFGLRSTFQDVFQLTVPAILERTAESATGAMNRILDIFIAFRGSGVLEGWGDLLHSTIGVAFDDISGYIDAFIGDNVEAVQKIAELKEGLLDFFDTLGNSSIDTEAGKESLDKIFSTMSEALAVAGRVAPEAFADEFIQGWMDNLGEINAQIQEDGMMTPETREALIGQLEEIGKKVSDAFVAKFKEFAAQAWEDLKTWVHDKAIEAFQWAKDKIAAWVQENPLYAILAGWFMLPSGARGGLAAAGSSLFSAIFSSISGNIGNLAAGGKTLAGAGKNIATSLVGAVVSGITGIPGAGKAIMGAISDALSTSTIGPDAGDIARGFAGLDEAFNNVDLSPSKKTLREKVAGTAPMQKLGKMFANAKKDIGGAMSTISKPFKFLFEVGGQVAGKLAPVAEILMQVAGGLAQVALAGFGIASAVGILLALGGAFIMAKENGDQLAEIGQRIMDGFAPVIDYFSGLRERIGGKLAPALAGIKEAALTAFSGLAEAFVGMAETLGAWFEENQELIDAFIVAVMGAVSWFAQAVAPVTKVIGAILQTILDVFLGIAKAFMQVVTGDFSGAFETLKGLFSTLWDDLKGVWETAKEWLSGIADDVGEWFGGIKDKLDEKIPEIIEKAKEIGIGMVDGMLAGLQEMWQNLWDWLWNKTNELAASVREQLGINSPSKVFMEIGSSVGEGMAIGIRASWGDAIAAVERGAQDLASIPIAPPSGAIGASGSGFAASQNNVTLNFNFSDTEMREEDVLRALAVAGIA